LGDGEKKMIETLLGGLLGGIFRIIPEVLKWLDRKDERKHEIELLDKQVWFEQVKGAQKIAEIAGQEQADWNKGTMDALKESISGQFKLSGVKWIDGFTTLMRPLITFQWVICLYPAVLVAGFVLAVQAGTPPLEALIAVFGILNFWFLSRVFDRVKSV
jgi:hypothetical protein